MKRVALIALAAFAATPGDALATFPGGNDKIAFSSSRDGHLEIYVMNADGSGQTRLTNTASADQPAWSPDGARIAYSGQTGIRIVNKDGTGDHIAIPGGAAPSWSPSGTRLVYQCSPFICVAKDDGTDVQQLTALGNVQSPSWSPRGDRIAYVSGGRVIGTAKPDGTDAAAWTAPGPDDDESSPEWAPDGASIVFARDFDDGDVVVQDDIYRTGAGGAGTTQLTTSPERDRDPVDSPDGTSLAWARVENPSTQIMVDGVKVTSAGSNSAPSWQPIPDRDGDSLLDLWETTGIDEDGDGTVDLVLADASPDVKDVYLEIDYMASHPPDPGAIFDVRFAFAGAPEPIALHVDVDESIAETPVIGLNCAGEGDAGFDAIKAASFGTSAQRNAGATTIAAKRLAYRYGIFGHSQVPAANGSSGCAERPGNDLIVTLGNFDVVGGHNVGTREQQAGTLMHELGHTLGLDHGGGDGVNCKPNYLSVMSYSRQFDSGPVAGRPLDYSRAALDPLDENSLSEPAGIGGPAGSLTAFGPDPPFLTAGDGPIDWNGNGNFMDLAVAEDVNFLAGGGCVPAGLSILAGHDDWANLKWDFRATAAYADGAHPATGPEMTYDQMRAMIVAAAPAQTTPPPPPCLDTIRPRASVRSLRLTRRALRLRGRASDTGCNPGPYSLPAGVARVRVAVARRAGKRCRFMNRRGRLTRKARSCKKPKYVLRAKGTANWQLKLKFRRRLPRGRYLLLARAVDIGGNVQLKPARRAKRL